MRAGQQQTSDRRLFMQFLAFGNVRSTADLIAAMEAAGLAGVIYEDANDPLGVGLLTWSDDPNFFLDKLRPVLTSEPFVSLEFKPEYTMLGRTYAIGYEPQLEHVLLDRPRQQATDTDWKWHVWYPLRRKGMFNSLPEEDQRAALSEHGRIGKAFGEAGLALDVRLASFGMDKNDNDFVIGLIGKELFPLSACVQAMRKTQQTSHYMESMGPFFVGRAVWQKNLDL